MKHKVGDKVRIKSKEWWDAQPKNKYGDVRCGSDTFTDTMTCMCGKVVEITDVLEDTYFIKEYGLNWTDEMFDDSYNHEKSILSEEMIKDIADVVKKHNLGVSISENEGKLIIEPLNIEEANKTKAGEIIVYSYDKKHWSIGKYAVGFTFYKTIDGLIKDLSNYIIPFYRFNPNNIEESLKYNIVKS